MPINILMPALSPTMEKGNLAKWLVKEGDKVASGDVIAEIETDKATMEVEAVDEGVLAKITVAEGTADVPVNQVIGIIDSYGYGAILGKLVWQRLIVPMTGGQADDAVVNAAKPMVEKVLSEFERIKGSDRFLAGPDLSLADPFLAPIFAYFSMTEDSKELLSMRPGLRNWWDGMSIRDSIRKTQPDLG